MLQIISQRSKAQRIILNETKDDFVILQSGGCAEAIEKLPLVQAFFPCTTATKRIQKETHKQDFVDALVQEFVITRYSRCLVKANGEAKNKGKAQMKVQFSKEPLHKVTEEADKVIGKQFRRATTSCHPDRFGDKYTKEFQALTTAYEFLKDSEVRKSYLFDTLQYDMDSSDDEDEESIPLNKAVQVAHEQWIQEHTKAAIGGVEQSLYKEAVHRAQKRTEQANRARLVGKTQTLAIQGGLSSMKPRLLGVGKINGEACNVQLKWQPLQPVEAFQNYIQNVVILIDEENSTVISHKELQGLYIEHIPEYVKVIKFPGWGIFNVSWYAQLIVDGLKINTERSDTVEIAVLPRDYERAAAQHPALKKMAREMASRLQRELYLFQTQRKTFQSDHSELQERNLFWHRAIGSAQVLINKLESTLEELGQDTSENPVLCPQLAELKEIVNKTAVVQPTLADAMEFLDKKATRKSFARGFEIKLAKGAAGAWLQKVTEAELVKVGGDTNRLYQLLTQGKSASLFIDSPTLQTAAARSDMFSSKQRKTLLERSDEVEAQKRADLEKLVKEQMQQDAVEKEVCNAKNTSKTKSRAPDRAAKPEIVGLKTEVFALDNSTAFIPSPSGTLKGKENDQKNTNAIGYGAFDGPGFDPTPSTPASATTLPPWFPKLELPPLYGSSRSQNTSGTTKHVAQAPIGSGRFLGPRLQEKTKWDTIHHPPFLQLLSDAEMGFPKPQSSLSPLTVASVPSEPSQATGVVSLQDRTNVPDPLLKFLHSQKDCLKQTPDGFYKWLLSEDVTSLVALDDAVACDDFLEDMKNHGLKFYKRYVFKNNCKAAVADSATRPSGLAPKQLVKYLSGISISLDAFYKIDALAPRDLQCPISSLLMVVEPVVAADGRTYEHHALQDWITSKRASGEPVTSPQTGEELADLSLRPNTSVRNIAREYLSTKM